MPTFFTADTHFGHENILRLGAGRPFATIREHDEALIANWNAVVGPRDDVWHLGDFAHRADKGYQRSIFHRLNGRKRLIVGNHDTDETKALPWTEVREHMSTISVDRQKFVLFHYPILEWPGFWGTVKHLHGHTHESIPSTRRRLDVSVDSWGWTPVTSVALLERALTLPDPSPRALPERQMSEEGRVDAEPEAPRMAP